MIRSALVGLLTAAVMAPTATAAFSPGSTSAAQAPPNVLVIMTDDQTVESVRVMTNVKRLLRDRGATFANSFVTYALCCPSRATFLTGQYAHNHGVLGNVPPAGGYAKLDHTNTLPVWLQDAGYYTAHLGKYLNGYGRADPTEIPPGYDEWRGSVDPSTYRFYGYKLNENGRLTTYETYQTDLYAQKAARIIRRRAPSAQPFFLWVAFLAPHSGGPREPDDPADHPTPVPLPAIGTPSTRNPSPGRPGSTSAMSPTSRSGFGAGPASGPTASARSARATNSGSSRSSRSTRPSRSSSPSCAAPVSSTTR
jgi:N-acetylglucosamine-6-sulfatase